MTLPSNIYDQNVEALQSIIIELHSILGLSYEQSLLEEVRKLKARKEIEQIGWRIFDGEGGYDYYGLTNNETLADDFIARNGQGYASWVEPLFGLVSSTIEKEST